LPSAGPRVMTVSDNRTGRPPGGPILRRRSLGRRHPCRRHRPADRRDNQQIRLNQHLRLQPTPDELPSHLHRRLPNAACPIHGLAFPKGASPQPFARQRVTPAASPTRIEAAIGFARSPSLSSAGLRQDCHIRVHRNHQGGSPQGGYLTVPQGRTRPVCLGRRCPPVAVPAHDAQASHAWASVRARILCFAAVFLPLARRKRRADPSVLQRQGSLLQQTARRACVCPLHLRKEGICRAGFSIGGE
jgi:hypothetical protein